MFNITYSQKLLLGSAVFAVVSLGVSYGYFQHYLHLKPCPLCQIARVLYAMIALFSLVAATFPSSTKLVYLPLIPILVGSFFAIRHLWMIWAPMSGSCVFFDNSSVFGFLQSAWLGTADCSIVTWELLGLNIPEMVTIQYVLFLLIAFAAVWTNKQQRI